jgi:hypothetical protein
MLKRYSEKEETFWQKMILPEEDRLASLANTEWKGGYRWFRSENIVCLEHYRVIETKPAPRSKAS